jgi:choline-sulfatase
MLKATASLSALPLLGFAAAPASKPNLLVIMSDEHTASITGCYGNTIVRTPNLDGLAAKGVTFDACYTTSPLCVPARLSFTSGKYVSRNGAWSNSSWLPSDEVASLPRLLNDAGYETVLCGKMHYDATRRYGFSKDLGLRNRNRKNGRCGRRPADDITPRPGISERFRDFRIGKEEENGCMRGDLAVTQEASTYLRSRQPDDKPYFLLAGYLAPHFPLIVPQKYWEHYRDRIPMPVLPPGHLENLPLNYKHLRVGFHNEDVPPEIVKKGRELYYGFVEWFDEQVGLLLQALADTPDAENTVVVYTTDHGEDLGEHGLWWKNCMYEHAARIPCIISWPPRWRGGQRRTLACSTVDIVQTLAELAGTQAPDDWDGNSMVAWLDDAQSPWRDIAISQYYAHNIASGFVMLRQGPWKYVYHSPPDSEHPAEEELYNLTSDPGEFRNLASDPAQKARTTAMLAGIVKELGEHPDEIEARARADFKKGYQRDDQPTMPLRNKQFGQETKFWDERGVPGRFAIVKGAGRNGTPALRFHKEPADNDQPTKENSHYDQFTVVAKGVTYRVGMWVKAEGDLQPVLRMASMDSESIVEVPAGESRDWQYVEGTFSVKKPQKLKLQIFGGAKGKIRETHPGTSYVDMIVFEEVEEKEE